MLNNFKLAALASVCVFAVSCASPQTEKSPVSEEAHYQPVHRIEAGKTIVSDKKNASYEKNGETTTTVAKVPVMPELKGDSPAAAKIKPVEKKEQAVKKEEKNKKAIPVIRKQVVKTEPSMNYQIASILFADGSAVVDASYNAEIAKIAALAKKHNAQIHVYGFSSSRTKDTDIVTHKMINFNTSLKRAESVAAALRRAGVKKENITVEALSDSRPLFSEVMPEGERQNRRAEIYISY
uniref:OmpA-like domain-containing protein n=1 Tax=uncultured Alphaproteobacteria bacterium TaxID=91750 RepID=A0A6G8F387_9PROT|nr:hypothetical protein PlAlph_6520 [uncultured Alphaproteobacteria bacterium]